MWSIGIIILEILLGVNLWKDLSLEEMHKKILDLAKSKCFVEQIAADHGIEQKLEDLPNVLKHILTQCLSPSPSKRCSATDLLKLPLFDIERASRVRCKNGLSPLSGKLRSEHLELYTFDSQNDTCANGHVDYISERGIDEVYHLWSLAGGDLENELNKKGMIKRKPPVFTLPNLVLCDGEGFGREAHRTNAFDETVVVLSLDTLHERLKGLDPKIYYPLIEDQSQSFPSSISMSDLSSTTGLPLVIREQDIEYQLHRTILFKRLIDGFPYKRAQIWKEARVDIPPLVRPHVWAALLDAEIDNINAYEQIDKQVPMVTDRQIEVDIPRCHQYNELLSSPEAHKKFKRILKAWVISHPHYVYWQGLDSLCAVFLYLNFNDEALAYACLTAFINKYLHKFFLRDNSPVIQEYLAVFSHMIALHDPELTNHLDSIGFIPELYSIPWFLTMYTHVFPLHKIFHLWDTLLLGDSSLPLFIGVAILKQLRDGLLSFGFNECILLFSDMPDIDIAKCVQDSISYFRSTPKSATFRTHAKVKATKKDDSKTELKIKAIPLSVLKSERSPRISAEDLLELCALSPTASQTYNIQRGQAHTKVLLVDVRNTEDYMRGTVPGALNIQFSTAFTADGDLVSSPAVSTLYAHCGKVIIVIGNRGSNASNFADVLVKLGFPKVCVLHKGIDVLRSTGILCVPTPEI